MSWDSTSKSTLTMSDRVYTGTDLTDGKTLNAYCPLNTTMRFLSFGYCASTGTNAGKCTDYTNNVNSKLTNASFYNSTTNKFTLPISTTNISNGTDPYAGTTKYVNFAYTCDQMTPAPQSCPSLSCPSIPPYPTIPPYLKTLTMPPCPKFPSMPPFPEIPACPDCNPIIPPCPATEEPKRCLLF